MKKKKETIIKTWRLHKIKVRIKNKERVYEFFGLKKSWYYGFLRVKGHLFQPRKLVENLSFFNIYETCMIWSEMRKKIYQFLEKRRWDDIFFSMEYHVYLLLKSSRFEFFGDGKQGLFWTKELMEKWYLLITQTLCF